MKLYTRTAAAIVLLALAASPMALAAGKPETVPPANTPSAQGPEYEPSEPPTPGPKAGLPEKAKAYGRYCQGESKQHVAGEQGTAFSRCVTKMARAATHPSMTPSQVCKGESKQHVKGEKGTAFSRCVKAAAKLRHHEEQEEGSTEGTA